MLVGRYPEDRYSVNRGYVDALHAVGAQPILVPAGPGADVERVLGIVETAGGVVLTGGGDVEPAVYGHPLDPKTFEVDPDRDRVEVEVVRRAAERRMPILGICRGIQLLTVALGGSLVQDLCTAGFEQHWHEDRQHEPVHAIDPEPGSLTVRALAGATTVNSIHHQAVAEPGPHLRASAWSPDGVIEAVEGDRIVGLQWHPERLLGHDRRHLAPFAWVAAA